MTDKSVTLMEGQKTMFATWLNNFQYQDKLALRAALRNDDMHVPFELAVAQFVDDFEQSYSVDAPYPKRIGRWVGLHAPLSVVERLLQWSKSDGPCQKASRYRAEFRSALEVSMIIDRSTRPQLRDAA
jgi:hypothetical protein